MQVDIFMLICIETLVLFLVQFYLKFDQNYWYSLHQKTLKKHRVVLILEPNPTNGSKNQGVTVFT